VVKVPNGALRTSLDRTADRMNALLQQAGIGGGAKGRTPEPAAVEVRCAA